MNRKYVWAAIGFVVLLGLLIWQHETPRSPASVDTAALPRTARTDADGGNLERECNARRKASGRLLPEGEITSHHYSRLKDFVLPKCVGRNVSLSTALNLINDAYKDACFFSLETPLKLTYNTTVESEELLTFCLTGKTWKECIECVAALAGMQAEFEAEVVTLIPLANANEIRETTIRLHEGLTLELKQMLLEVGAWDATIPDDTNAGIPQMLHKLGIIESASINLDNKFGGSRFIDADFRGSNKELIALCKCAPLFDPFSRGTYKISAKLISSKESLDFSQKAIEPAEAEELLHSLAEQRDVMIKSFDPLHKQLGEIARIENTQMENDQFNGIEITYDTEFIGLKIGSKIEVSFAGLAKNQKPPASQILTFSGDSQIKHLGSDANGHYYLFTTLQQIINMQAAENISNPWLDSTIRTSINYPKARSVPGMPTHVYSPYGNTLIEVKGIPSGELMSDPAYPDADGKIFRVP